MKRFALLSSLIPVVFSACQVTIEEKESEMDKVDSASLTGIATDLQFTVNGKFTVGFVAKDAAGNAVLAEKEAVKGRVTVAGDTDGLSCSVPGTKSCEPIGVASKKPSASREVLSSVVIDDSGSMAENDPANERAGAAKAFLKSVCEEPASGFGVMDFGAGSNLEFSVTRDVLTADSVNYAELPGASNEAPFASCSEESLVAASSAIDHQIRFNKQGTPLYESVYEVCMLMAERQAQGEAFASSNLAMLVLSDGQPTSQYQKTQAEECIRQHEITLCTVGLGQGSELFNKPDPTAVQALKDLAEVGGCVYGAATDPKALEPVFKAVGTAVSNGQNFAEYQLSPVPPSGTKVTGTLQIGAASVPFSFVAP